MEMLPKTMLKMNQNTKAEFIYMSPSYYSESVG